MDPNATLDYILDLLITGEGEEAAMLMRDLADWIDKGGFLPDMKPLVAVRDEARAAVKALHRAELHDDARSLDRAIDAMWHCPTVGERGVW